MSGCGKCSHACECKQHLIREGVLEKRCVFQYRQSSMSPAESASAAPCTLPPQRQSSSLSLHLELHRTGTIYLHQADSRSVTFLDLFSSLLHANKEQARPYQHPNRPSTSHHLAQPHRSIKNDLVYQTTAIPMRSSLNLKPSPTTKAPSALRYILILLKARPTRQDIACLCSYTSRNSVAPPPYTP